MSLFLNTKGNSKAVITVLLICIVFVLVLIFSNLYLIIFHNSGASKDSVDISFENSNSPENNSINENMEFISKAIICGDSENKHIRSFVNSSGNPDLYGIKFIVKDKNGLDHTYINNTREALPFGGSVKRIDVTYLELNLDPSLNVTNLKGALIFKDTFGNDVIGSSISEVSVCYSSCNDCSSSCELVCP